MKTFKTPLWYLMQITAVLIILSSCKKTEEEPVQNFIGGLYVVCEGNYNDGNTSISFYNNGAVANDIFKKVNKRPLGDQAQSITIHGDKAYVLVQHSGKIEVVNATTFESVATIDDRISGPRFMVVYNQTGYVSDAKSRYIKMINLSSNLVTDSIAVDDIPEGLLIKGTTLYVTNTKDYPDQGDKISIIDLTTNTKTGSITTPANPGGLVQDADGNIWALCGGDGYAATVINAALVKINPANNTITTTVNFSSPGDFPYYLQKNSSANVLYYMVGGQVFKFPITATTEPTTPFITRSFYNFGVNPANDDVIGTIVPNYTSGGKVIRYSSAAVKLDSATVGIAPGFVVFK